MPSVDNRVVEMQFDNKSFEQNAGQTISTLDKLKSSLDFSDSKKGINDLTAASNSFQLNGIATAIQDISSKFTSMGAVAFSVIDNIVTRAVNAGISLGKSLSLDRTMGGFREYELNMRSIQTILANTKSDGTNLEQVNAALDQLNQYSDQTIYNFGEMARNIGTFTAAGIDLETSVTGIKGIANLAAISGSSSQQAASAMYQLSQALASGTVKLIDWNSVVNAGMGGEVFQKALFETGKTLKTISNVPMDMTFESWKKAGNSFRGSLEKGWITSEVLINTLKGFTGDLTDAQLRSIGYNEEQIRQIQEMGQTGKDAATKVKTLTQLISTVKESIESGWSQSFRIIIGDFESAQELFTNVNNVIGDFVNKSADARNRLLAGWERVGGRERLIEALGNAFKALGSIISSIRNAFYEIFPRVTISSLVRLTIAFEKFIDALTPSKATLSALKFTLQGVFAAISIVIEIAKQLASVFGRVLSKISGSVNSNRRVFSFFVDLGKSLTELKEKLVDGKGIEKFFDDLYETIDIFLTGLNLDNAIDRVVDAFKRLKNSIFGVSKDGGVQELSPTIEKVKDVLEVLGNAVERLGSVWDGFVDKVNAVKDFFGSVADFIQETFGSIPQKIADVFAKADYNQALDTINTGLFGGLVVLVGAFFSKGLLGSLFPQDIVKQITLVLDALQGRLEAMQTNVKADTLTKIAGALALLAVALLIFASIDSADLTKAMIAAAAGLGVLVGALYLMEKYMTASAKGGAKLALVAAGMVLIAGAMVLLAIAVKIFATMSWTDIAKGLTAVTGLLLAFAGAMQLMSGNAGGMIRAGLGIIAIAIAMNILAGAVKLFSMMSWTDLARGFAAIAVGLLIMAGALTLMPWNSLSKGVAILAIAIALNVLAGAVKLFAMMDWKELGKGFAAVATGLLIIAGALALMPSGPNLLLKGLGILAIALAMAVLAGAVKVLASMSWEELGRGLAGIAVILGLLAAAVNLMKGAILGAAAISIVAGSLLVLLGVVKGFSTLSWADLIKGLIGMAAVLGIMAAAALLLEPSLPALLTFAGAVALIGLGFILLGAGASLLATAFSVFLTSILQALDTFIGSMDILLRLIPAVLYEVGKGIVLLLLQVVKGLPTIVIELGKTIGAFIQLLIDNIPLAVEAFIVLVTEVLDAIVELAPKLVETGYFMLTTLLEGISENIEKITNTVLDIIFKFVSVLTERMPEITAKGAELLASFITGISNNIATIVSAGVNLIMRFLDGIGDAIPNIASKITEIIVAITTAISDETPKVVDAGFQMFIDLFNGLAEVIRNRSGELGRAMGGLVSALVSGIGTAIREAIKQIANDLFPGLGSVINGIYDFFGINSPSKVFYDIGDNLMLGLKYGIDENLIKPTQSLEEGSALMLDTVSSTMGKIAQAVDQEIDSSPKIRPVVDLTGVTEGASAISNLLNNNTTLGTGVSYDQASLISSSTQASATQTEDIPKVGTTEIKFEQNNYSPEALSPADIYRQTRNQIAIAKEELALL